MGRESPDRRIRLTNNREPSPDCPEKIIRRMGYFAWDNRCTRKTFFGIASFSPFISPKYHRTCILDAKSRINLHRIESNEKIVRKIVPFDRLYPLSSVEITDDEALNERKNTIDDTHTSCRHYYPRDSNRGRFFFIPMERQCLTMIYGL